MNLHANLHEFIAMILKNLKLVYISLDLEGNVLMH